MSYTFDTWLAAVANTIVEDPTDTNFLGIVSSAIDYAEQRLYAELDLLNVVVRQSSRLNAGNRNFNLPTSPARFVVVNGINLVITPTTTNVADAGQRFQLVPASRDYLDAVGGDPTQLGQPVNYAMITDQMIVVGPLWPDQGYLLEVIGTTRPAPLSMTNQTTYLTQFLPQLWFAATMIFFTGWQQNFGSQADNPQMAVSWESEYTKLFASIDEEEQRKRYASGAWGSLSPTTDATTSR